MVIKTTFSVILAVLMLSSCETPIDAVLDDNIDIDTSVNSLLQEGLDRGYWYSGQAEVSKYELEQYRYRDVHEGELVTIFVTEDFLTDKQVKNDNYTSKHSVPILKLNALRRFTTGIYDYSMMTSVFTRADGSSTEKITLSSQDWCGQSFVQVNKKGDKKYQIQLRSYFESEGDRDFTVSADLLEDEIPNLIRIDPELIPTGEVNILPSLVNLRFSHGQMKAESAQVARKSNQDGSRVIELTYPGEGRTVSFAYDNSPMRKIQSWNEVQGQRQTKATLSTQINEAYWSKNAASDLPMRTKLGLSGFGD